MTNDQIPMTDDKAYVIDVKMPSGMYDVRIGPGLIHTLGELLIQRDLMGKIALITDDIVGPLHAESVLRALSGAGLNAVVVTMAAGEAHKNLDTVRKLYDSLLDAQIDRSSTILALGGGVVGDTAGFVAATYMRGLRLVQAPTTLLAMVDASIGGKVGVDLPRGKNLVGAFKQPSLVVADLGVLATLPLIDFVAGFAEVIKHAIIADPELFDHVESHGWEPLAWVLQRAIDVKRRVVEEDPFEQGRRVVLNLGHTFGHALEVLSDYELRHGFAVSIGLLAATRVALRLGLCSPDLERRILGVLVQYGLPISFSGASPAQVWNAMAHDKKRVGDRLRFVLPRAIGEVIVTDEVSKEVVIEVLTQMHDEGTEVEMVA